MLIPGSLFQPRFVGKARSLPIVSKVSKWDNLVVRSADFYFPNVNNLKCTLALYLYSNEKKGKQANSERDRERERVCVRESERCRKDGLGVRHKTSCWKNPVKSFWDKLGRINFSWETILMEERDRKDTLRLNILREIRLMTIGTMTCRTFSIIHSFKKLQEKKILWDPTLLGKEKKYLVHFKVSCWDNWRLTKSHSRFKENGKHSSPTFPPLLQNFFSVVANPQ